MQRIIFQYKLSIRRVVVNYFSHKKTAYKNRKYD